jgi:hypothetical protein
LFSHKLVEKPASTPKLFLTQSSPSRKKYRRRTGPMIIIFCIISIEFFRIWLVKVIMNYPAASSGVSKPQYFFDNTNAPRGGECTLSDSIGR